MKAVFFVMAILINFLNHSLVRSEEKIQSSKNKIENISTIELLTKDKNEIRKIHIVKNGETVSSISKLYSISKDLIIKLNNLKDVNNIYIGQNLIISKSNGNSIEKPNQSFQYHVVQIGETLTEIANRYKLKLENLIEINALTNPDSIKVGEKILLNKNNSIKVENYQLINNKKNKELVNLNRQIYGPLIIDSKSLKKIKDRKVLNILNQKNKKLILSINCDTKKLDVRIPGRLWQGEKPAKEEFEKNLINDFC